MHNESALFKYIKGKPVYHPACRSVAEGQLLLWGHPVPSMVSLMSAKSFEAYILLSVKYLNLASGTSFA